MTEEHWICFTKKGLEIRFILPGKEKNNEWNQFQSSTTLKGVEEIKDRKYLSKVIGEVKQIKLSVNINGKK